MKDDTFARRVKNGYTNEVDRHFLCTFALNRLSILTELLFAGILEVDQLGFTCLMTSEGSKCEKLAASSDPQGKSLKVNVQPQTGHLQESSMPLVSIDFLVSVNFRLHAIYSFTQHQTEFM